MDRLRKLKRGARKERKRNDKSTAVELLQLAGKQIHSTCGSRQAGRPVVAVTDEHCCWASQAQLTGRWRPVGLDRPGLPLRPAAATISRCLVYDTCMHLHGRP